MNSGFLILSVLGALGVGHAGLRKSIESAYPPDPDRTTPAYSLRDDVDFIPAAPFVLFGHHWMSIAGTSAITASIVGLAWGWLPAILWMVFGVLFVGAPNDFYTLMVSVRNEGATMTEIITRYISRLAANLYSNALCFGGILIMAIFISVVAKALTATPSAVIPTIVLTLAAVLQGYLVRRKVSVVNATIICAILCIVSIRLGLAFPIHFTEQGWAIVLIGYTILASVLPVDILLQPRDYLNALLLIVCLVLGLLGLLVGRPAIQYPAFIVFQSVRGPLWPMLFATISCGAASGWHAMINAGTTSRQLSNEKYAYTIAYGGMQMETVMALLSSTLVITTFTFADYSSFTMDPGGTFASGLGKAIMQLGLPEAFGTTLGVLALSALTLTTMDSYARNSRLMIQEVGEGTVFSNIFLSTFIVILIGTVLLFAIPFMRLWTGMVLIALVGLVGPLIVICVERAARNESWYGPFIRHVVAPLCFIYPTAYAGLIYMLYTSFKSKDVITAILTVYLIIAATVLLVQGYRRVKTDRLEAEAKKTEMPL